MTLQEKKALVARFIGKCNQYAERQLARYRAELKGADERRALELQDKIGHWTAYRAFNAHTLAELEGPDLDDWFD
jgi:hypothetical protein